MKRIIDIPEEVIKAFENGDINNGYYDYNSLIGKAIRNSTPLNEVEAEDCISRQSVLDLAKKGILISNDNYKSVCKAINELPSVYPKSDMSCDDCMWLVCNYNKMVDYNKLIEKILTKQESVLEDIKAEIETEKWCDKDTRIVKNCNASGLEIALKIIDNHISGKE